MFRATQDIHLNTARTKVVPNTDPDAMFLFAPAGSEVSDEDVRKYGLVATELVTSDTPTVTPATPARPSTISTIDRGVLDLTTGQPVDTTLAPPDEAATQRAVDEALQGQARMFDTFYNQLQGELKQAQSERDAAVQERDAATAERDKRAAERDNLQEQVTDLRAQLDAAKAAAIAAPKPDEAAANAPAADAVAKPSTKSGNANANK